MMLLLSSCLLTAQDSRARVLDNLQTDVGELRERLRHFKMEREMLEDRLQAQSNELAQLKKEIARFQQSQSNLAGTKSDLAQGRINALEKGQEALCEDLKTLQKHFGDTSSIINQLSDHVEQNQASLKGQVADLKRAVESLVGLLQKSSGSTASLPVSSGSTYKVKAGDTLEKIAKANGLSLSTLKKLNDLSSDRIAIGQELRLE